MDVRGHIDQKGAEAAAYLWGELAAAPRDLAAAP